MDAHANFAVSSVAVAPSPATTGVTLTVASGDGARFPVVPFNATIAPVGVLATPANAEIVRVTARTGDVLTIVRTQEATTARAVQVNDLIAATITTKTITDIETPLTGILGGQLPFPAVPNPSANPNTLDEYKEGAWTPILTTAVAGSGVTYSVQAGRYIKIGRLVVVSFDLVITSFGGGSGLITLNGLPYVVDNASTGLWFGWGAIDWFSAVPLARVSMGFIVNTTTGNFYGTTGAVTNAFTGLLVAQLGDGGYLRGTMFYLASQ